MTTTSQAPQEYLTGITTAPRQESVGLREVARVVFPANHDLDVLPLYVDGPFNPDKAGIPVDPQAPEEPRVVLAAEGRTPRADAILSRRSLRVEAGTRTSLGSYFNAFPAGYWRRWTVAEKVVLRVRSSGPGAIVVYRSNARGVAQRVESRRLSGEATNEFELSLSPFGDGGWYWFDLVADDDALTLVEAGWFVASQGRPVGRVTLGITTFNRPDYCVNTIATIGAARELDAILVAARERAIDEGLPYAGIVSPQDAWALATGGAAIIVDVRTAEEYKYVGHVPGAPLVQWQSGPALVRNPRFTKELGARAGKEDVILLLCRSGKRSAAAAEAATRAGFRNVFNIREGFEGDISADGQRGATGGWRYHGLPWNQD
jgi:rhodanese-related sulfurtransferase